MPDLEESQWSPDNLQAIAQLASALWSDGGHGSRVTLDVLAATRLSRKGRSKGFKHACQTLLAHAQKDSVKANASQSHMPFFRMQPEERWILSALHINRWTYARVGDILGWTSDQVQEVAWSARLELATFTGGTLYVPAGSGGSFCPVFEPRRPWMQRFFDEELNRQERTWFETHLKNCSSCHLSLQRGRAIYYAAASHVPRLTEQEQQAWLKWTESAMERNWQDKSAAERNWKENLLVFFMRRDVIILSFILILLSWSWAKRL